MDIRQDNAPNRPVQGVFGTSRSHHLPEKFLVASIVVRMAPCKDKEGVWETGGRR